MNPKKPKPDRDKATKLAQVKAKIRRCSCGGKCDKCRG